MNVAVSMMSRIRPGWRTRFQAALKSQISSTELQINLSAFGGSIIKDQNVGRIDIALIQKKGLLIDQKDKCH